jgi:hypothetical protein
MIMRNAQSYRRVASGVLFAAGVAAIALSALTLFAGAGLAARKAVPVNTSLPTIAGTAQVGNVLTGGRGSWNNDPTAYDFRWVRCDRAGGHCSEAPHGHGTRFTLTAGDVGHTIRLVVVATNSSGRSMAISAPTAVVQGAAPPPSRGNGCPPGAGSPDQVTSIAPPARLQVDTLRSDPRVVTRGTQSVVVRFHVSSTCGGPVQGALVYATATPYNQFAIPPEAATGGDGWATLVFQRLAGFPVSGHQQLIAMFVRARKPGENVLAGISNRRLVSIRVDLGS